MTLHVELQRLAEDFESSFSDVGWTEIQPVLLTKGDGTGALLVANGRAREIWVRRSDTRELFTAYGSPGLLFRLVDGDVTNETVEVRIGYPPGRSTGLKTVMDNDTEAGRSSIGSVSPMEAFLYQAFYSQASNLSTLRARPTTPTATNDVSVDGPYFYAQPSTGLLTYFTTGSVGSAVASAIAALSAGQHALGIVYLDKEANTLGILTGTAVSAAGTLPSRSEFGTSDVASIAVQYYQEPIIPVYLYYGQTSVSETDFFRSWDLRSIFSKGVARPAEKIYLHTTYSGLGGLLGGALGS